MGSWPVILLCFDCSLGWGGLPFAVRQGPVQNLVLLLLCVFQSRPLSGLFGMDYFLEASHLKFEPTQAGSSQSLGFACLWFSWKAMTFGFLRFPIHWLSKDFA